MGDFEAHFSKGQEIEVGSEEDGFKGSWYAANIVQTPLGKDKKRVLIEYKTLMDDVEASKPLREYVDTNTVRPRPPPPAQEEGKQFFELGEVVEAYHNDGWWEGTINQVLEKKLRYRVYFKVSGEEIEFQKSEMRKHRQWICGRWVSAQELQTLDSSFCVGASVEVCLDDEKYCDAWFPATLLKRINYSSFLVEYQSVRLQYMVGKLKETVDSLHIRPLPPDPLQNKHFGLLEKVDAFYDCGWWSGVVTRIFASSKYTVFFKHRREQKDFSHSELRYHMDWIDGKWIQNLKEILSQCRLKAPGQVQSGDAGKNDQNIDNHCGAAKNVVAKKSPLSGNSRKVDNHSTPDKMSSAYYTINSCKNASTTESDTACIDSSRYKKLQLTFASNPDITISSKMTKKMQSTPESGTRSIISSKKKKMQSTTEGNTESLQTCKKLKTVEVVKTTQSLIACHARAMDSRVQTEADGQYDFATQATKGHEANIKGKCSLENVGGKRVESPILSEIFFNCSEGEYKDHPKDLNSDQEQPKLILGRNGSRDQCSVEGSSHLLPNIIDVEQYEVVKTQVPARPMRLRILGPLRQKGETLACDDINQQTTKAMSQQTLNVSSKDAEHSGTIGRLQAPFTCTEAQSKDPEQTTPSKEIQSEDAEEETDIIGTTSNIRDLHQPSSSMCLRNSDVSQIVNENGFSSSNQPTALSVKAFTREDSPITGSKLQSSLNVDVSSFSFEGGADNTLLDQAIGDEVGGCCSKSFLVSSKSDQMLLEDESFPFIKCSPLWKAVESLEVFHTMPQKLHFRPLEQLNMALREGLAIGNMWSFANIVEKVGKTELDDPCSILHDKSKNLTDLKAHGFNVQPVQARLETLLQIKDEQAKLNDDLLEVEYQINMKCAEKTSLETEVDELNKKMRELQECLNQQSKKRGEIVSEMEVRDSSIAEMKKTMDTARGHVLGVASEFLTLVAAPW